MHCKYMFKNKKTIEIEEISVIIIQNLQYVYKKKKQNL